MNLLKYKAKKEKYIKYVNQCVKYEKKMSKHLCIISQSL